ncbi:MAG: isomerase/hydrolase [Candidatus Kapabacteria bacterium]|nr:isomerase/hydrolase [Candidatus Kapabacteria bacterium]
MFTDGTTMPVGTMYCIGRNYAAHAAEMGAAVPTDPIVFLKPPSAYAATDSVITLPSFSTNVHHEVELVVVMGPDRTIAGYAVGLDLTARDLQAAAKQRGEPWATAKSWARSAPVSHVVPASQIGHGPFTLSLEVNGEQRQHGSTGLMERSVAILVDYLDSIFTLQEGDCIFTGTPEGVARVMAGDVATARLDDVITLTVQFA